MYNTVGETAGVTQDVGSDPTVRDTLYMFCMLCGMEVGGEGCQEVGRGVGENGAGVRVFDFSGMSGMEEADEDEGEDYEDEDMKEAP